jgi:hypothetical protein
MTQVYKLLDAIRDKVRANPHAYTVSTGDIWELDLEKTTAFPLAHITVNSVQFTNNTIVFTIRMMALDIVDMDKEIETRDMFYGNSNIHDVFNTQLMVVNDVVTALRRGELYSDRLQLINEPSAEKVQDRFGHLLAGWSVEIEIAMPNEISIC